MSNSPSPPGTVIRLGLYGACFRPLPAGLRQLGWSHLIVVIAFGLLLQLYGDWMRAAPGGGFRAAGLPDALFGLPLVLFAAWLLSQTAARDNAVLPLAVALAAIALPIDLAALVLQDLVDSSMLGIKSIDPAILQWLVYYASLAWYVLAAAVVSVRLLALPSPKWIAVTLVATCCLGLPYLGIYRDPTLWRGPATMDPQAQRRRESFVIANEQAIYAQPALLEHALTRLLPNRKNRIDLYLLAAGGYADEDVFMKEVQSVTQLFAQRFGTDGRSVMLVNNPKTVLTHPMASVTALQASLNRIGALMERDEDLLFLFLTSHGSRDHKFALEFGPVRFQTLDPKRLRQLLDESGIRHRVIVVSACYSGGYVDALKDSHSMVITASAADRNSFGCSNENDFTYFGRAYFDEALRATDDFIAAFELAKPIIAEREKAEDFVSSNPQIFIGEKIRDKLAAYRQQRGIHGTENEKTGSARTKPVSNDSR